MYENSKTLVELVYNSVESYGDKPFLKYRVDSKFETITYNDFLEMSRRFAASLYEIGLRKGDKVGIVSDNLYKWMITDIAVLMLGGVDVPRGSDSTAEELQYILEHSDSKCCVVENARQAEKIISIADKLGNLEIIIMLNGERDEVKSAVSAGVNLYLFDELLVEGEGHLEKHGSILDELHQSIDREDLATIIYTSGTTGMPKGVMLLHKNIMQNVHALTTCLPLKENERWVSVLPVWHVFERTVEYNILAMGALMAYSKPVAKHLLPDMEEIKPTFMVSVPRIWEGVYNGILIKVKSGSPVKRALFNFFIKVGTAYCRASRSFRGMDRLFRKRSPLASFAKKLSSLFTIITLFGLDRLGDILIYKTIRGKTGGDLKMPISGGGKLPLYVDEFFAAIKIDILEGYGMTESAPVIAVRTPSTLVFETVGRAIPGDEIMIGDENWNPLPSQADKGVVYVKGDNVMAGYYKEPEKTAQVIKDGWLNTGDLGRLTISGELQLVGRAKDTIVLLGGENIEPEPIECKLLEHEGISQVMIVGQDRKKLGALICPAKEYVESYASEHGLDSTDYGALLTNEAVIKHFTDILKREVSLKNGYKSFERVTSFALLDTPFEVGRELTHSLKMRRNVIADLYKDRIEAMYQG